MKIQFMPFLNTRGLSDTLDSGFRPALQKGGHSQSTIFPHISLAPSLWGFQPLSRRAAEYQLSPSPEKTQGSHDFSFFQCSPYSDYWAWGKRNLKRIFERKSSFLFFVKISIQTQFKQAELFPRKQDEKLEKLSPSPDVQVMITGTQPLPVSLNQQCLGWLGCETPSGRGLHGLAELHSFTI